MPFSRSLVAAIQGRRAADGRFRRDDRRGGQGHHHQPRQTEGWKLLFRSHHNAYREVAENPDYGSLPAGGMSNNHNNSTL